MQIDPTLIPPSQVYALMIRAITPRPIAWVSTISVRGVANLAPFSFFSGVGSNPPSLLFSCVDRPDGTPKDTVRNINAVRQFVVNIVPFSLAEKMEVTSGEFEYEDSEFSAAQLVEVKSNRVAPPGVALSPIRLECELMQIVKVGNGGGAANICIGKIVWIEVADEILDSDGKIDPLKTDSIGRMGGRSYCRTGELFELGKLRGS